MERGGRGEKSGLILSWPWPIISEVISSGAPPPGTFGWSSGVGLSMKGSRVCRTVSHAYWNRSVRCAASAIRPPASSISTRNGSAGSPRQRRARRHVVTSPVVRSTRSRSPSSDQGRDARPPARAGRPRSSCGRTSARRSPRPRSRCPSPCSAFVAMARPDDCPKCLPATTMSPGCTFTGTPGPGPPARAARSPPSARTTYCVFTSRSVGMLSPNFQQRPSKFTVRSPVPWPVISPAMADAATVAADARYIGASALPLRPGKLRACVEIIASPAAIAPMLYGLVGARARREPRRARLVQREDAALPRPPRRRPRGWRARC